MKIFSKKSVWILITAYMAVWLVIAIAAGYILDGYKNVINATLGLSGIRTETLNTGADEDLEYYKSDFVQKNADGSIKYVIDEKTGYKHQVYDDKALREVALKKASQVQKEGTTILWNSETNGLPLNKGDEVSLFSHSTVDWVHSGGGSGNAYVSGAANMKKALTDAGLSINTTLWNFYSSGEGSSYTRTNRYTMNEVPWNVYTDDVKNSFSKYNDAAIIVLSRKSGEGSVAQGGAFDVTQTEADTPSGDYYDLSSQERKMIEEVINLKKVGTFKKVIVLLNTATDLWLDPILDVKDDIDCCMWVGQTGYYGLNEVGKILVGDSIPSGHLVDTFLQNTQSNPAFINSIASMYSNANSMRLPNLGYQSMYLTYAEGIYVGYKYYETRYEDAVLNQGNATSKAGAVNSVGDWKYSEEVAFPFGYGGSYTTFEYSNFNVTKNTDGDYEVTLTVKNVGDKNGADAVQVYIQKPYTEYDKEYEIEQAAVNLVGYAKTAELEPNATEEVKIRVRDDAFKTYDANNAKTYIREKTEGVNAYYITAAQDAHDAVNNILAAKGKTPANSNGVMDAEGNTSLVKMYEFADDDFTTYATSETGVEITNQFDDTDWNKYENKTEGTLVYLSRKDWQATYPTAPIKLSLNDKMVYDLSWNKEVEIDPKDKMPLYDQPQVFNLIDLKDLDYNHSAWDTLLDQLTLEEQIKLLGTAYHGTKAVVSIAKPAETTKDGPLGIRQKYKTNSSEYTLSYPSTTLLAASYNDKLALEVGELMGEDMLHAGITGIYGPGANIHRMTYSGRNYEYYSEDGFISGMMCKWQVIGIQSKGCYVNIKHIALNDQENNRYGIGIWANEQSIREVYLPAFEYVVKEGTCTGLMSAFNRFGTKWSGAHKGLLTNVLRNEWGFNGFVISDCAWRVYMGVVDGVMAGNDCILDNADLTAYYEAESNPTIAQGIRESTHRILYVIVNTCAMNGYSANTKIYEVKEWWQHLVTSVQIGIGSAFALCLIITVLCFLFHKKILSVALAREAVAEERRAAKQTAIREKYGITYEESYLGDFKQFYCIGQPWHLERILKTVISCVLAAAIITTAILIPVLTINNKPNVPNTENNGGNTNQTTSLKDLLEGEVTTYRFEAESANLETAIARCGKGWQSDYSKSAANYPSGQGYIYYLSDAGEATITFKITASKAGPAVIGYSLGCSTEERLISDLFSLKVNGKYVDYHNAESKIPVYSSVKYFDWKEIDVALIELVEGENTITLVKNITGLNLDYISITSAATLQDSRCVSGHNYGNWIVSEPTYDHEGKANCYCNNCYVDKSVTLPVISEANGYTKNTLVAATENTFGSAEWSYTASESTFKFTRSIYHESAKEYKFEAETSEFTGSAKRYNDATCDASNNSYLGSLAGATWTITYNIYSEETTDALLILRIGRRNDRDVSFSSGKTLTVNGTAVSVSSDVVFKQIVSDSKYMNWAEYEIAKVSLVKGRNKITIANAGSAFTNLDYIKLVSTKTISWFIEGMEHEHAYSNVVVGVNPTYTTAGELGTYCNVCNGAYNKIADLPEISTDNGYTNIRSGAISIWQYSYEGVTYIIEIEEENAQTYMFICTENDPFSEINDGSSTSTLTTEKGIGTFYGNDPEKTFNYSLTVTVDEATNVTFVIRAAKRYGPYTQADIFGMMTLNGSTDGVTYTDKKLDGCGTTSSAWGTYVDYAAATLSLKKGVNVIDFSVITSCNVFGVGFISLIPVKLGIAEFEHTCIYDEYIIEVSPTYTTTGELGTYCNVCNVAYKKIADLPAISTDNGYTNISSGVISIWQYTYEDVTYTIKIEEENAQTYMFICTENDPFSEINDGSSTSTLTTEKGIGTFYGNDPGKTFNYKISVTVEEATNVTFVIRAAKRYGPYTQTDIFGMMTLNGSTDGVTYTDKKLDGCGTTSSAWGTYVDYAAATLSLKKGVNVIDFSVITSCNVFGIGFISILPVTLGIEEIEHTCTYDEYVVKVAPTYTTGGELGAYCNICNGSYKKIADLPIVSTENSYTQISSGNVSEWQYTYEGKNYTISIVEKQAYKFTVVDNNPFNEGNGGSVIKGIEDIFGLITNKYGTFYQNTRGATFTLTINVEEATEVDFAIFVSSTADYSFNYADAVTSITLNGSETGVARNEGSVNTVGWYTSDASAINVAKLSLSAGKNVITFTMGEDTAKTLNISAIEFVSAYPVTLG